MTHSQFAPGQWLGNYSLSNLLGRGGFAEVYLGEHRYLRTLAAIKILHANLANQKEVENFQQEARTIAALDHSNIVRVLDFDVSAGTPFIAMTYAPGGSLRQRHPRGQIVPLQVVLHYVKRMASALHFAHGQRIVHRDVKPDNMLVNQQGEPLLSDFGIASIAHSTASLDNQGMAGTIPYMAPEQIQGKPRPASDQYALAVTVYAWVTGRFPFQGNAMDIAVQHLEKQPPRPRLLVSDLPPTVEDVLLKALAKEPQQRYSSINDFSIALEQAIPEEIRSHPLLSFPIPSASSPLLEGRVTSSEMLAELRAQREQVARPTFSEEDAWTLFEAIEQQSDEFGKLIKPMNRETEIIVYELLPLLEGEQRAAVLGHIRATNADAKRASSQFEIIMSWRNRPLQEIDPEVMRTVQRVLQDMNEKLRKHLEEIRILRRQLQQNR